MLKTYSSKTKKLMVLSLLNMFITLALVIMLKNTGYAGVVVIWGAVICVWLFIWLNKSAYQDKNPQKIKGKRSKNTNKQKHTSSYY